MSSLSLFKRELRRHIWNMLESRGVALPPKPIYHRIPNFKGADRAAKIIAETLVFKKANTIKIDPDSPLKHIRMQALMHGKTIVMPTPRLRRGFVIVDPNKIGYSKIGFASTIRGAMTLGKIVDDPYAIPEVDLFIVGCVAVSRINGVRIGKGGGFGDLEYAILLEAGKITYDIAIIALVHDLQVLNRPLPKDNHDVPVDLIATPTSLIRVLRRENRPRGILCDKLSKEYASLPIIRKLAKC